MHLPNFNSYQLSVQFYRSIQGLRCPTHLRDQLLRAASSVCLNLAEGAGKGPGADAQRYFRIALGSVREVQAVLDLLVTQPSLEVLNFADQLGACVFRLCHPRRR